PDGRSVSPPYIPRMPLWTLPRKLAGGLVLAIALALGWAAVVVAAALAASRDQATTSDAIVVLGAAQYNGRPSPVFRARLDHAAALYQRGLAPVVLVTGGVGTGDTLSEAEVGRRYLVKAGLPEAAVLALPAGTSTSTSLDGVAHWFKGRDSRRVLLVSDGFHMLRLQIIATRLALVPFTSPAPCGRSRPAPSTRAKRPTPARGVSCSRKPASPPSGSSDSAQS